MEYIINKILMILQENNISLYSFAKQTKINKSTMHKLMHMERKLKPKYFYTIIDNLPASLSLKHELTNKYNRLSLGEKRYNANLYILNMINSFSEISFTILNDKLSLPGQSQLNNPELAVIYKGDSAQHIINLLLIEEMHKRNSRAFVYMPGNSPALKSYIDNVVKLYNTDIKINFLIDIISSKEANDEFYNLSVLKNILPIALSMNNNYNFYYTYINKPIDDSYLTPYPYFIVLSDAVIWLNASADEALVIKDTAVVKNLITRCEGKLAGYRKLLNSSSDIISIVNTVVENQPETGMHCCIEYEPCLAFYFTEEMIDSMVPAQIPNAQRSELIKILNIRKMQLDNITKSIQLFNKNSLKEFAQTGIINEFPTAYSRPCTIEERQFLLTQLLNTTIDDSNEHLIRAVNPINLEISDCLSLIIQDESCVQFTVFNDKKMPLKYLTIKEPTIGSYFKNFIMDSVDSNMVYSKEDTIDLINEAIGAIPVNNK